MTTTVPPTRVRLVAGWVAVAVNLTTAAFWAFWGSIEAFHEGWWHGSWLTNVLWSFAYLVPAAIFVALGLIGICFPRIGAAVILAFTVWFWWWWGVPGKLASGDLAHATVGLAMSGAGGFMMLLWWFGRAEPRKWAMRATAGVPLLVAIVCGARPAYLVLTRMDDGDLGVRTIEGNGVTLVWAPAGPGWPQRGGVKWEDARYTAEHLSEDGTRLLDEPQRIWRLPTRDEAVRSMVRRGGNAGGTFDPTSGEFAYARQPNKETPLWNPRSEVIYWWTADELDAGQAWSIAYNGSMLPRRKEHYPGTLGLRLVKAPDSPTASPP
ncbi:MAG: hypothetical protein IT449_19135 [Phycisphaerales bacterium]|nr:hypothetical protein [Phycisphaerales bacterium]